MFFLLEALSAPLRAGIDFTFANHLSAMFALSRGIVFTQPQLLATYAGEHIAKLAWVMPVSETSQRLLSSAAHPGARHT